MAKGAAGREIPAKQMESQTDQMELHQVDNERQGSVENWKEEVILLKQPLADKDEELSRSIKRWQMGTLDHVEVVKQLSLEMATLDASNQKRAALKESHVKQLLEVHLKKSSEGKRSS